MKDKLLRVLVHTVEFLAVLGVAALVMFLLKPLGLEQSQVEVLGLVSAGVTAALAKFFREMKADYVNGIGK